MILQTCLYKNVRECLTFELLIFCFFENVFRNFVSGERKRVCVCFVRAKDRMRCYLKLRAVKFGFEKIIGSSLFIQSGVERQSRGLFLPYKNAKRLARGHGIL